MIKAEHSKWARLIFNPYIERQMRKSFANFYLVHESPGLCKDKPLVVTPNHISWWDGFFVDYINRKLLNRKFHIMMLESSLKRYWFFKKLGAFSIDPKNNISVRHTVQYTREILRDHNSLVATYPQGEIEPFEKTQRTVKEGLRLLLTGKEIVLPIAFKIQYYNEKNPAVLCRFGDVVDGNIVKNDYSKFADRFNDNIEKLQEAAFEKRFYKDLFAG